MYSVSDHLYKKVAKFDTWHGVQEHGDGESEFAIVFAAMGVNMETAHFFKQVSQIHICHSTAFNQ